MTSLISFNPRPPLFPFPYRYKTVNPKPAPNLVPKSLIVKSSFNHHVPELETAAQAIFDRAEGFLYTVADAVVSSTANNDAAIAVEETRKNSDWLSGIANYMETVLKVLKGGLSALHVPYAYGFAIILLTVLVKAATFPLTKKQVESAMAMRSLQPQVKAIQQRYAGDQEKIQLEMARLYKLAGVNPLAGCLPTLATIPVWIGLYRALSNVADEGLLNEAFFWIPSLSGPTTIAARQSGSGTSWLFPFVDGQPPLGWSDTLAYLVLPVLLVISQYISAQVMQPVQSNDPSQKSSQAVTKILPLMIGYFALSVPSGLSLYWFTNNILSTAQQLWLQKLGGAKNPVRPFTDNTDQDELSNAQKSVFEVKTEKVNASQEVKVDSGGHRPGERFKQIKEQEEKRRKQREEDERREEEEKQRKATQAATVFVTSTQQNDPDVKEAGNTDEKDSEDSQTTEQFSTSNNGGLNFKAGLRVNGEGGSCENMQKDHISDMYAHDAFHGQNQEPERDEA